MFRFSDVKNKYTTHFQMNTNSYLTGSWIQTFQHNNVVTFFVQVIQLYMIRKSPRKLVKKVYNQSKFQIVIWNNCHHSASYEWDI